jgi:acyl dehydratase
MGGADHVTGVGAIVERLTPKLGSRKREYLGEITRLLIQRYARAVGDDNPLYHDPLSARRHGHPDVIAPPNLLASIVEWGVGSPEHDLRPDGTDHDEDFLEAGDGVRVMGGGERMRFHKVVAAGTHVTLTSELVDVSMKSGRKGDLVLAVFENTYTDQRNEVLCVCTRTVIAR